MLSVLTYCVSSSEVYSFIGLGTHPSICGLTVFENKGSVVLVFTDLADNEGTSVTNSIAHLATEVYEDRFSYVPLDKLFIIEHYGLISDFKYADPFCRGGEEFDLVSLTWSGSEFYSPEWKRIKSDNINSLLPSFKK